MKTTISVSLPLETLKLLKTFPINATSVTDNAIQEAYGSDSVIPNALWQRSKRQVTGNETKTTSFSLHKDTLAKLKRLSSIYGISDNLCLNLILEAHFLTKGIYENLSSDGVHAAEERRDNP